MYWNSIIPRLLPLLIVTLVGCGGGDAAPADAPAAGQPAAGGLSAAELEKGVGPIQGVTVGPLDETLARKGEELFTVKCSACHKFDQRYVGPSLGGVTARRTPEYIMNMILNPEGMIQQHPEAKKMLAQFLTPMPNQHLTEDEARAVLEYLRTHETTP